MYISITTAEMYFQETRQKLDIDIASHIASENDCFTGDSVNTEILKEVFHNVMIINPSIEVYLLDKTGRILMYFAPNHSILIDKVPLDPINEFISTGEKDFLMGIDPKNPVRKKAFSAAKVVDDGVFKGYIYVILGGQEFENASQLLFGSYILRLGVRSMIIALVMAAIIGFISIGIIIRNLRKIVKVIREFQSGNQSARINFKGNGELEEFASSFNEMADTIVRNMDEIKEKDRLRRELIANVSHDLRTPLSVVRGYIETVLIKDESLSPEEKTRYLEIILQSTDGLMLLVKDLFELSGLEASETKPDFEQFSVDELLQDIYQKNLIIAEQKKITFTFKRNDHPGIISGDIRMIEKVFQNLIDNAFKFTPETGTVIIKSERKENNILISISDTGSGIEESEINNIFDRYHQIKRVANDKSKGFGLGLAIVKKILDLHGFKISVESSPGKGASFIISIPS